MQQMILVVCKLITTCLELPNANTAVDAERWDWLLLICVQTGEIPVQIPEPMKACHRLYLEINCVWHFWPHFTKMSWLSLSVYRAMLCIRGTSHGPVSVCLCLRLCLSVSITSRSSTKTAKRRITQTTPHDSPGTLDRAHPLRGRRMQVG